MLVQAMRDAGTQNYTLVAFRFRTIGGGSW
jgi:hypothetical protein